MGMQSDKFVFLRAGVRPPQYVIDRLRRFHPDVKLAWNYALDRWMLVQRGYDGVWYPLMLVQTKDGGYKHPDLSLLHQLNAIDVRCMGYWEIKEYLDSMEREDEEQRRENKADIDDIARDMAGRIYHDQKIRRSVAVNGSASDE